MDPDQLLSMNKALIVDMNEKKRKIKRLVKTCEELFTDRGRAESSFRCIQRHWRQVGRSIAVDNLWLTTIDPR